MWMYALAGVAGLLFLLPLLYGLRMSYAHELWWGWYRIELTPFPSPLATRSPIGGWMAACLVMVGIALVQAFQQGTMPLLAGIFVAVEVAYALLFYRGSRPQAPDSETFPVLTFGLWHNGLLEELWFRGLWLLVFRWLGWTSSFAMWCFILSTAILFGLYHFWRVSPIRALDTTAFGVVLGYVTWQYGLPAAVLLHLAHNALAVPLYHQQESAPLWWRNRRLLLAGLTVVALTAWL